MLGKPTGGKDCATGSTLLLLFYLLRLRTGALEPITADGGPCWDRP